MTRRTRHDEPDEDDDSDGSDEYDAYRGYDPDEPETYPSGLYDDGPPLVPCPHCREEIVEDAERCPYCGNYLSKEDAPREARSRFWVVMMLLALLAAAFWTLGG